MSNDNSSRGIRLGRWPTAVLLVGLGYGIHEVQDNGLLAPVGVVFDGFNIDLRESGQLESFVNNIEGPCENIEASNGYATMFDGTAPVQLDENTIAAACADGSINHGEGHGIYQAIMAERKAAEERPTIRRR